MALPTRPTTPAASTARKPNKFDAIARANPTVRNDFITAGHYLVRIDSFRARNGFRAGAMHVAEMTVVHVFPDSKPAFDNQSKTIIPCNTIGQSVSDIMKESNVAYADRMRNFLDAAGELSQDDWDTRGADEVVNLLSGEEQPIAGLVVELLASTVTKDVSRKKPTIELVSGQDTYVRAYYKRRVTFAEVSKTLSPEALANYFPDIAAQVAAEQTA